MSNLLHRISLFLVALFAVTLTCCAPRLEAQTANAMAIAANAALPMLVDQYKAEGIEAIDAAASKDQALAELAVVRERWRTVWQAWDAVQAAHDAWATSIEQGVGSAKSQEAMRTAYCNLLELWPKGLPAMPLSIVRCSP